MDTVLKVKLVLGLALFATWLALIISHIQGAEDIISFIKYSLGVLGAHTAYASGKTAIIQPQTTSMPTPSIYRDDLK